MNGFTEVNMGRNRRPFGDYYDDYDDDEFEDEDDLDEEDDFDVA